MRSGIVEQRHGRACAGGCPEHGPKACPWGYRVDVTEAIDGKRRQLRKGGFKNKTDAREALDGVRRRIADGEELGGGLSVAEFLEEWHQMKVTAGRRESTLAQYRIYIDRYLTPILGNVRLADLRAKHVDAMLAKMRSDGRGLPTQHRVLACLSSALSGAERRRLVTTNITRQIEIAAEETPIRPVYSHKKLGQFLDHVADDRLHALWHLYAVLGLRRGEALGLTWSMVDLDNKTLRVERSLGVVDGKLTWGPPKSKSGVRTVAMDGTTVSLLRGHWARQGEEKLALGEAYGEGDLVFARADGAPLRPEWVSRRFLVLAKDAGLPVIHLHDLRHSAASMMLTAGVPMKVVSTNLGHSAMAITADVYSHVTTELALAAAELTASALAAGRSELA